MLFRSVSSSTNGSVKVATRFTTAVGAAAGADVNWAVAVVIVVCTGVAAVVIVVGATVVEFDEGLLSAKDIHGKNQYRLARYTSALVVS